jgi:hypothetical protein
MAPSPCCVAVPLCVLDPVVNTPQQTAKGPGGCELSDLRVPDYTKLSATGTRHRLRSRMTTPENEVYLDDELHETHKA